MKESQRVLFVLAHQDDELCITGKIKQLADAGKEVSLLWTRSSNNIRIEESTKAMVMMGVQKENMRFWNYGNLSDPAAFRIYIDRFAEMISIQNFDQVYVVAYEGGHIEHDLTHIAAVTAFRESDCAEQGYSIRTG